MCVLVLKTHKPMWAVHKPYILATWLTASRDKKYEKYPHNFVDVMGAEEYETVPTLLLRRVYGSSDYDTCMHSVRA